MLAVAVGGTDYVTPAGNVATATQLTANAGNCASGSAPLGVDTFGAVENCFDVATQGELDAHVTGTAVHSATAANTPSRLVLRDATGNFSAGTITAALTGTASTASALAANGGNCTTGLSPLGVDTIGAVEGCFDVATQVELDAHTTATTVHSATAANTPNRSVFRDATGNFSAGTITAALAGTANTATSLAANGGNCAAGLSPLGIDASGVVENCFDVATQVELDAHTNTTAAHSATAANTPSRIVLRDATGNFSAGTITAALDGTATTATALVGNGANCTTGLSPLGVDTLGAVEGCFDVATQTELDRA